MQSCIICKQNYNILNKKLLILILLISAKNLIGEMTPEIEVMEKEHLIEQLVISNLKNSYGIDVANLISLPLGADADALIYKVQTPDQTTYFVKLKRGQHDISMNLQLLLHDSGIKEIISPTKTLNGQPKLYINNFTLIVYPFIDGQDGFNQNLTDDQRKLT